MLKRPAYSAVRSYSRVAADALGALALFAFVFGATSWSDGSAAGSPRANDILSLTASTGEPVSRVVRELPTAAGSLTLVANPTSATQEETVFRRTPFTSALLVLAAVFSLLAAGNLAFLRHLRRVAAPVRRGRAAKT